METGHEIKRFTGHTGSVFHVAFSPDGKYALTADRDETAKLWSVQEHPALPRLLTDKVFGVAVLSPDGRYVLTGGEGNAVLLLDATTGVQVKQFTGHTGPEAVLAFSPRRQTYTVCSCGKIRPRGFGTWQQGRRCRPSRRAPARAY